MGVPARTQLLTIMEICGQAAKGAKREVYELNPSGVKSICLLYHFEGGTQSLRFEVKEFPYPKSLELEV